MREVKPSPSHRGSEHVACCGVCTSKQLLDDLVQLVRKSVLLAIWVRILLYALGFTLGGSVPDVAEWVRLVR